MTNQEAAEKLQAFLEENGITLRVTQKITNTEGGGFIAMPEMVVMVAPKASRSPNSE